MALAYHLGFLLCGFRKMIDFFGISRWLKRCTVNSFIEVRLLVDGLELFARVSRMPGILNYDFSTRTIMEVD